MTRRAANTLKFAVKIQLHEFMKEFIQKDDDGIHCQYVNPTINDEVVANKFAAKHNVTITASNVAGLRKEMFGSIRMADRTMRADNELLKRINLLEANVKLIASSLGITLLVEPS